MKKITFRKKRFTKKILIVILALALCLFLLNFFQKEVKSFFYGISTPAQKFFWRIGDSTSNFLQSIVMTGKLKNEVNNLKTENQNLLSRVVSLDDLKKENETLRAALSIGLEKEFKLMPTQIIGKDVSQDIVLVDKGLEDGVQKNMPLIDQQKVLFGKVSEVYNNSSKVTLISSKNISFDGKIVEKDIPGLVKGDGGLKLLLDLLPRDKEVNEGDTIISSGLGGVFPKDLLVGKIKKVVKNDVEPIQKAEVEPFFNIADSHALFLISGY